MVLGGGGAAEGGCVWSVNIKAVQENQCQEIKATPKMLPAFARIPVFSGACLLFLCLTSLCRVYVETEHNFIHNKAES